MLLRIFKTILIIYCFSNTTIAQENIVIKATIKDQNNNPLPFCFVTLKNINTTTVTNEEGVFELHIKSLSANDTVIISYIGYETYKQSAYYLIKNNTKVIFLKTNYYSLKEVTVSPELTAQNILKNVYKSFEVNYSDSISLISGFFRTYLKTDNKFDKLVESDINMLTKGFNKKKSIWTKYNVYLNETRGSLNTGKIKEGKGVNSLNEIISIHENYLNQLKKDKLFNSKVQIEKIEYDNQTKIYDLLFQARNEDTFSETTISLKINSTNWAVVQLNYYFHFYEKNKGKIHQSNIDSIRFRNISDDFIIKYTNFNGKYYLSFFKRDYKKEIISPTMNYGLNINTEFVTNQINEPKQRSLGIPLIRSESLYEQVCKTPYHRQFWEQYNLILENSELAKIKNDIEQNGSIDEQFNNANKYPTDNKKGKK